MTEQEIQELENDSINFGVTMGIMKVLNDLLHANKKSAVTQILKDMHPCDFIELRVTMRDNKDIFPCDKLFPYSNKFAREKLVACNEILDEEEKNGL